MNSNIPYFQNGKIKNIETKNNQYIVYRYYDSSNVVTKKVYEVNDYYEQLLQEEYYSTIKEYLKKYEVDYNISQKKELSFDNKLHKKNIIMYILGIIGMTIPFIGIFAKINILLSLGIFTLILGIFSVTVCGYNLKKIDNIEKRKQFVCEYDKLKQEYSNKKNVTVKQQIEIKPSINPIYDLNIKRIKKKN